MINGARIIHIKTQEILPNIEKALLVHLLYPKRIQKKEIIKKIKQNTKEMIGEIQIQNIRKRQEDIRIKP